MLVKEYRIRLPFVDVEKGNIGQLYTINAMSCENSGGGEGVELVHNEPFEGLGTCQGFENYDKGQYTYKIYHIGHRVPSWLRFLLPDNVCELHEEAWNSYPYCRSVISNPRFMKKDFYIMHETFHGTLLTADTNPHGLTKEALENLKSENIDITDVDETSSAYEAKDDPNKFHSEKLNVGPPSSDWWDTAEPMMSVVKLCSIKFNWGGPLQGLIEKKLQNVFLTVYKIFYQKFFCGMDSWLDLTAEDIRQMENNGKEEMKKLMKEGQKKTSKVTF